MGTTRGTTPSHTFEVDIDLTTAEVIYITYKQDGRVLVEKEKNDITLTKESLEVKLTQEETLKFRDNKDVKMQIRARYPDDTAVASNVMTVSALEILKEGEI